MVGRPFEDCYEVCPVTGCWLWTQSINGAGYGSKTYDGESLLAHRLSWLLHRGPIPSGMQVLHRCDVRVCVNPEHLFIGTQKQNLEDAFIKGRAPQLGKREYCKAGHPLTEVNLYLEKNGEIRRCLQCRLASRKAYSLRKSNVRK